MATRSTGVELKEATVLVGLSTSVPIGNVGVLSALGPLGAAASFIPGLQSRLAPLAKLTLNVGGIPSLWI